MVRQLTVSTVHSRKGPASWPSVLPGDGVESRVSSTGLSSVWGFRRHASVTDAVRKRPYPEEGRAAAAAESSRARICDLTKHPSRCPISARTGGIKSVPPACRTNDGIAVRRMPEATRTRRILQMLRGRDSMKKLTLSKETLRTLDDEELTLVVGGAANSGQFNPAKCPSSGHPNCK
jgi:hypothetical protein